MKQLLLLVLLPFIIYAQNSFRIYPSSVTQTEPVVTVDPNNPNILFASAVTLNTLNGFKSEGIYVSTDAGLTWSGSDTSKGANIQNHGGDPAAMITPDGKFVSLHIGNIFPGLYSHYSTNRGATWSNAFTVTSQQTEDKGSSTIDNSTSSPYYERLYTIWVNIATPAPVYFSTSSNSGASWTTQKVINPTPPARCSGGSITTDKYGKVYASWSGMTSASPFYEDFAGFASSSDGGSTWNVKQNIFDMNGISGTPLAAKSNIRVNGLPQIEVDRTRGTRSGWLYIVTNEKGLAPAGNDPDIILHRSTDGGNTWSNGIRVNQDALNNSKIQYFPAIEIDEAGGINIIYYDDRNTASDSAEVILSRSTDGGDTWTETVISGHRFKPKPILGGSSNYQGDHIALKYSDKKLYAMWMDDFSGIYQVWCNIIPLNIVAVNDLNAAPAEYSLKQNYPNPFNPETKIAYSLKERVNVNISVYNLLGEKVRELVNEQKESGTYTVSFNSSGLPSGIYIYRMTAGQYTASRKMTFLK